ncbi:hypothetical protein NX875_29280, partial [Burkholderia thailandensis]|uniref:MFS transporter n=1 Tax=Burkholderia thailandensis TaxID=57975 RepID=UPI0035C724FB|nr:hypothetical protein [Burkholderia thailandensis]
PGCPQPIARHFYRSFAEMQRAVCSYRPALAAALLPARGLGDRAGRKRVLLAGLAVFFVAALGCGLAPPAAALNVARAVKGVGASPQPSDATKNTASPARSTRLRPARAARPPAGSRQAAHAPIDAPPTNSLAANPTSNLRTLHGNATATTLRSGTCRRRHAARVARAGPAA